MTKKWHGNDQNFNINSAALLLTLEFNILYISQQYSK